MFEYRKQIKITEFQKSLEGYLKQYVFHVFDSVDLSPENIDTLFKTKDKDERNWYALYLIPLLGGNYLRAYIDQGYSNYAYTGLGMLTYMKGHLLFNSYLTDDVVNGYRRYQGLLKDCHKVFDSKFVQEIVYGTRRLLWSFILLYGRENSLTP